MKPSKKEKKNPRSRFVLEGNALYEIDEECVQKKMRGPKARPAAKKGK